MGLRDRIPNRVHRIAVFALILVTAMPAGAVDWDLVGTESRESGVREAALLMLAPGQTIGWLLASGEVGWGKIAVAGPSTLITESGLALDRDNCHALWRPQRDRGRTVTKGVGYGLATGALASTALYANYHDDDSNSWGNLFVGLGIAAALVGGLVIGVVAGVVAPGTEYWQLIYLAEGADSWQVDRLPHTSGRPRPYWLRTPWVEITPALGSTGWNSTVAAENQNGLRTAVWFPVGPRLDLGGAFGFAEQSSLPGSSELSAEALLRLGGRTGEIQPYLVTGIGWYGPLGDLMGFTFGGGLRIQVARRWAVSLEAGAVNGLSRVEGDKPGRAWIGIGIGHSLGTSDTSH